MNSNFAIKVAHSHVKQYVDSSERWKLEYHDAQECFDCQDWLQKGIEAFRRIRSADEMLNDADRLGFYPLSDADQEALDFLYKMWLKPCRATEEWIADLARRDHVPDNLQEFRNICAQARQLVSQREKAVREASSVDLSSCDFMVTFRDERFAKKLFTDGTARLKRSVADHGIVEE